MQGERWEFWLESQLEGPYLPCQTFAVEVLISKRTSGFKRTKETHRSQKEREKELETKEVMAKIKASNRALK